MIKMNETMALDEIRPVELAEEIKKHARESRTEADLKTRVESLLRSKVFDKWNIPWAAYEHRDVVSGVRKDALYGTVIIEYKDPGKLESKSEFGKAKEQVKKYIADEAKDPEIYSRYFGVVFDGYSISFIRFRKNEWEEQDRPLEINAQTVLRLLEAIRGLRKKPIDAEFLLMDFGPRSETSRKSILALYEALKKAKSARAEMLFNDWKRAFSQACAYSPDKFAGLIDYYGLKGQKDIDVEKLTFAIHTYYTILMKLLTSEIVTLFADSLLGSYLKDLEEAYYKSQDKMRDELKELEEGGIFSTLGIKNFLEADYFAWYLNEWNTEIAQLIVEIVKKLLDYEPATVELSPERVKDLFKRLYQNLMSRDVRHKLGEYYTPDWLAELLLDEVGYDGNPDKRVLDPACGSGTFLVLTIKRIKEYADEHFLDKRELIRKIIDNVKGIDLNPLAVLASKANYLIALSDLLRYRPREGIEIPIYLADSISVVRKVTPFGEDEFELQTNEGKFWITKEVIDKNLLYPVLRVINEGLKIGCTKEEFEKLLSKNIPLSRASVLSFIRLYEKISKLEDFGKNRIWTSLLKNAFSPMLIGKFDYVVGNPPWINWENLPEFYRNSTKELWNNYGLLEKTKGMGLGKVKRDIAMLFVARCFSQYVKKSGALSFLIPFNVLKTQGGVGFRKFLANSSKCIKVHDLSELYPFEGATNRTGLIVIQAGKTEFPVPCLMWSNPSGGEINQEEDLTSVYKATNQNEMILVPVTKREPDSPWMIISEKIYPTIGKIVAPSQYIANEGVNTALSGVFWVDILSKQPTGLLIKNTAAPGLKKRVKEVTEMVEANLVYPLVRGRDVKKWHAEPSGYIILPHDPKTGAPLNESEFKVDFQKSYKFLFNFRKELEGRSIHKLLGRKNPFYSAYGIGAHTFKPYKVVYKDISGKISAKGEFGGAMVMASTKDEYLGEKIIIPDNTLMFIPCESIEEAHYLAAILNSITTRFMATAYTVLHVRGHIMKYIGIKKFDLTNALHQKLSSLSKKAHELAGLGKEVELKEVEEEIDKTVAKLYGITNKELEEIKKTLKILKEGEVEEEETEEEEIVLPKARDIEVKVEPLLIKENETKELSVNISNNSNKNISGLSVGAYLGNKLLASEKLGKIIAGSSGVFIFKSPKLSAGEYDIKVVLDLNGIKIEEKRKLFVKAGIKRGGTLEIDKVLWGKK